MCIQSGASKLPLPPPMLQRAYPRCARGLSASTTALVYIAPFVPRLHSQVSPSGLNAHPAALRRADQSASWPPRAPLCDATPLPKPPSSLASSSRMQVLNIHPFLYCMFLAVRWRFLVVPSLVPALPTQPLPHIRSADDAANRDVAATCLLLFNCTRYRPPEPTRNPQKQPRPPAGRPHRPARHLRVSRAKHWNRIASHRSRCDDDTVRKIIAPRVSAFTSDAFSSLSRVPRAPLLILNITYCTLLYATLVYRNPTPHHHYIKESFFLELVSISENLFTACIHCTAPQLSSSAPYQYLSFILPFCSAY